MATPSMSALVHGALALGQSAAFLCPEITTAIRVSTAFVGTDVLVQLFWPKSAPPAPATQAEMEQGFKDLQNTISQTAWQGELSKRISAVRQATDFHDSAFKDFQANKFGDTPSTQLTGVLAQDWQRVYSAVKGYADLSGPAYVNPLLDVRDWVENDALDDAKAQGDPGRVKWLKFELLPLHCAATAAYISFCKLALMLELREAKNSGANRDILPDDYLGLVPSPYFENVEQIVTSTANPIGCIKYTKDILDDYNSERKGLDSDIAWRKSRISVKPVGSGYQIHDDEAGWNSVHYSSQATADLQRALYEAKVVAAYATDRAAERGVGGLAQVDADGLQTLYQQPWDELRRNLLKNRRAWNAKTNPQT